MVRPTLEGRSTARDVKNRVRVFGLALQHLDCVDGGQDKQFDFVTLGFAHSLHDGQSTVCTTADDESVALPGDFFFYSRAVCGRTVLEISSTAFSCACGFRRDQ